MEKGPTKRQIRAIDESSEAKQPKTEEETNGSKVYYALYSGNESNVISCMLGGVNERKFEDLESIQKPKTTHNIRHFCCGGCCSGPTLSSGVFCGRKRTTLVTG